MAPIYTQIKIKIEFGERLAALADHDHRSLANMVEFLIDKELAAREVQVAADITAKRREKETWRGKQSETRE